MSVGALAPVAACAQGAADRLQSLLSQVPVAALEGGDGPIVAGWGNGDAVRWIAVRGAQAGRNPNTPNRFAALRSAPPNQRAIIAAMSDDEIRAAIGLTALDWVETWEVAQGRVRCGAMDIYPDSEMRLRGALYSRGFDEADRDGNIVMWLGEMDHQPSSDWEDPRNPLGGDLGLPLRMAFTGERAVWATGWNTLDLILRPGGEVLSGRPDAQALIGGLRRAGNLGGVASVRMWLRNGAEVPVAGAEAGPVEGLALADFANRETEGAAMVLLLAEGTDVDALAASLSDAWPILTEIPSPEPPEITAGGGTVTLAVRSNWGEDGAATNGGYEAFLSALESGRLGYLLSR